MALALSTSSTAPGDVVAVRRLAAASTLISSLELLARPELYRDDHLMSWDVGQLRSRGFVRGMSARALRPLMAYPVFRALLFGRVAASAALLTSSPGPTATALLTGTAAASSVAVTLRSPYGWDGADQMSSIMLVGLCAGSVLPELRPALNRFFAHQLCLSYLASGVAKAGSEEWRSGAALPGIASTRMYGNDRLFQLLRARPRWAKLLAWLVIVGECAFPLVLVVPRRARQAFMAAGLLFHAVVAVTMNLNTFFWSFAAAYPALEAHCRAKERGAPCVAGAMEHIEQREQETP